MNTDRQHIAWHRNT